MKLMCRIFIIVFHLNSPVNGISSAIPSQLLKCYRTNYTETLLKPPLSIQLLVELTRKIEWEEKDALNLRMFTTSLLHGLRFDGVQATPGILESEFVVPYRATGKQFYRFELIVDYLTSGKPQLLPYNSVGIKELCLLHEIISNTVHDLERGNEGRTCPELRNLPYKRGVKKLSRCPIEGGVVKTRWGTISPGHLIAAVAASLQETNFPLQNLLEIIQQDSNVTKNNFTMSFQNVNNLWVSTLAGDLAEVTIQQIFNKPKIGNSGIWNNTYLPRVNYLHDEPFDMTSAEILGGIDGLIIADKIKEWLSILSRIRFSQLLDMYYSHRGVAYDRTYRACERESKFEKILTDNNLGQQTASVARLLQEIGAANQYLTESDIQNYAADVVKEFEIEKEIVLKKYNACNQNIDNVQALEVIAILDETWIGYQRETLVGTLAEGLDVNFYGSTLGIINGANGKWLTNVTYSLVQLYEDLNNNNNSEQTSLNLSRGLESITAYLQNQTLRNCHLINRIPKSIVVLVMANSAVIRDDDLNTSGLAIKSIKRLYPETRILYVTSSHNSARYQQLAKLYADDVLKEISEYSEESMRGIIKELSKVPGRIVDFYCNDSRITLEDYVTPDIRSIYEINQEYIQRAEFSVTFKGNDYGEASICAYDSKTPENKECKLLVSNEEVHFNTSKYCSSGKASNVQFSVDVTKTKFKCSEFDCRYPDQMRLGISTLWTRKSGSSTLHYNIYVAVLALLTTLVE